jgi:uracil-DNA glycosylase family 4
MAAYPWTMGINHQIEADWHAALAALQWQLDMGAHEAICDLPTSAYDLPEKALWQSRAAAEAPSKAASPAKTAKTSETAEASAQGLAAACQSLAELDKAAASFELCELRKGARGFVAGIGGDHAKVLIICDPPDISAEKRGLAMDDAELDLLKKIFDAIGLSIEDASSLSRLHLAPALPWPLRGEAQAEAIAMMRPFSLRRIGLVQPKLVVAMGHIAVGQLLVGTPLSRARGQWHQIDGSPAPIYPMHMPAAIMKSAEAKRDAWADALAIKAALRTA